MNEFKSRNKVRHTHREGITVIVMLLLFLIADVYFTIAFSVAYHHEKKIDLVFATTFFQNYLLNPAALNYKFSFVSFFNDVLFVHKTCVILYLIVLCLFLLLIFRPKSDFKNIEHGSAEWSYIKDFGKRFRNRNNTLPLADGFYVQFDDPKIKNTNEIVVGGPGSKKTLGIAKPEIMQLMGSYVITDPAGEIYRDTSKFLRQSGYRVAVLNTNDMNFSNCYNPLVYIRNDLNHIGSDVPLVARTIMKNTSDPNAHVNDPLWINGPDGLLQAILYYLMLDNKETRTIERILQLLNVKVDEQTGELDADNTKLEQIFSLIAENDPDHPGLKQYTLFKVAAGKTIKSIIISLAARLMLWTSPAVCKLTYKDEMHIDQIGFEKTAIFLIISDHNDTFKVISALFFSQLIEVLYEKASKYKTTRLPVRVNLLLDEVANIGEISNLDNALATMRKYNLRATLILQNISQLNSVYKNTWKNIIANCSIFNYLGADDDDTLKYVSGKLGNATVTVNTYSETIGGNRQTSSSENKITRNLMTTDELSTMDYENSVVLIGSMRPFFCKKFDTFNHPNYKYLGSDRGENLINNVLVSVDYENADNERSQEYQTYRKSINERDKEIDITYKSVFSDKAYEEESDKESENEDENENEQAALAKEWEEFEHSAEGSEQTPTKQV